MPLFMPVIPAAPEDVIAAAERTMGVVITVRDLTGWLRGRDGCSLLPPERNSHRRQAVCQAGFAPACVAHCRHACTAALRSDPRPQSTWCWKGVREVLHPVVRGGVLHGYIFAGAWRADNAPAGPWSASWSVLPPWDAAYSDLIAGALGVLADGLWAIAERSRTETAGTGRAERIRAFIRADPRRGRAGLARHLGLSASRTSHAVREACGMAVQDLILAERVAAAQRLLNDTDLPVATIGAQVGWPDAPHFARIFRQRTGLPPARWRTAHRLV